MPAECDGRTRVYETLRASSILAVGTTMWHKLEQTRYNGEWTTWRFVTWVTYNGKDCPASVNPYRWKAMLRQLEIVGEDALLAV